MNLFDLRKLGAAAGLAVLVFTNATAGSLTITIANPKPPATEGFKMGASRRPDGQTLTLDSQSLLLDGKPWTPVMGEFHYARYPAAEWREELLKMKAGGVEIVSTYVFWIHHEEVEGQFDWSGSRDLRQFVTLCGQVGLKAMVRCGPWDHGEVRNGGFPDWLEAKGWKTRSDDTNYLARVKILYGQIAQQLSGLLWKDGGPVIGIQVENEFSGPAAHLMTLKGIARDAGMDVPLYTRTGWPALRGTIPFGELIPLYGVYAEGFWDRQLTPMPGNYKAGFFFSNLRTDAAIGTDILGQRTARDAPDVAAYPFLTCEIGAGMMSSYHRRILVDPRDSLATTLVKIGSGGASTGYYMYHGGENPDGKLSTLMESQATGMWNDMPVKNYDFQTALGEYGQLRPQYHLLRRLHLFLQEWGSQLAQMPPTMPDQRPRGRDDADTLRWSVRSDGRSGFVFVNNYQRLQEMPARSNVQFAIQMATNVLTLSSVAMLATSTATFAIQMATNVLTFPSSPVVIPANASFIWPFNLELGHGVRINWATAQPITAVDDGKTHTVFFAATPGVPPRFSWSGEIPADTKQDDNVLTLHAADGDVFQIVALDEAQSLALWKGTWQGRERVFLTRAGLVLDEDNLRLTSTNLSDLAVAIYPVPASVKIKGLTLTSTARGIFQRFTPPAPKELSYKVILEVLQPAGPPRAIPNGKISQPVAAAPLDADFTNAAIWRIRLPAGVDMNTDPILRLHYTGDVARVTLNGKLLVDDFYNGNVFEVGLRRYAPEILTGDLRIAILPLRKDAPIYMAQSARPDFGAAASVVALDSVELLPRYQVQLH